MRRKVISISLVRQGLKRFFGDSELDLDFFVSVFLSFPNWQAFAEVTCCSIFQKLSDGGMIIQQHERGDYMITGKGFRVMEGITEIYPCLVPEEN